MKTSKAIGYSIVTNCLARFHSFCIDQTQERLYNCDQRGFKTTLRICMREMYESLTILSIVSLRR